MCFNTKPVRKASKERDSRMRFGEGALKRIALGCAASLTFCEGETKTETGRERE